MSSPDLSTCEGDIQMLQNLRSKMMTVDAASDEFLREVEKIRTEDECLRNFKTLLEDLNTEKLALVNELRNINTDINLLEQVIRQAETSRQKSMENAQRVYCSEVTPLCNDINDIRDVMSKDRLPTALVDACDLEEVFANGRSANELGDAKLEQPNLAPFWPLTIAYGNQSPYTLRQPDLFNLFAAVNNVQQVAPTTLPHDDGGGGAVSAGTTSDRDRSPSAPMAGNAADQSGATSLRHPDSVSAGFGSLSKQQQPPMKTCSSCQQQIHRNAPICPLCKSKSRSPHPKKKQRQSRPADVQPE